MADPVAIKRQRKASPVMGDGIGDMKATVGFMMGKLEGIEDRQERMERKLDAIPDAMRDAFAPLAAQLADNIRINSEQIKANSDLAITHAARITELEKTDAIEKATIIKTEKRGSRVIAAVMALLAMFGLVETVVMALYHK